MQSKATSIPTPLKIRFYINFLSTARNRIPVAGIDTTIQQTERKLAAYPPFNTREDFIFLFCVFDFHNMLQDPEESRLYYPGWYKSYRDSIAKATGVPVGDSTAWRDFAAFWNGIYERLVAATRICDEIVRDQLLSKPNQSYINMLHESYHKIWSLMRFHYSYWRTDDSLRLLILSKHSLEPCDYEQPLFTKFASYLSSNFTQFTQDRASNQKKSVASSQPPTTSTPLNFVEGCSGVGYQWFHQPSFVTEKFHPLLPAQTKRKASAPPEHVPSPKKTKTAIEIIDREPSPHEEPRSVQNELDFESEHSPRPPTPPNLHSPIIVHSECSSSSDSESSSDLDQSPSPKAAVTPKLLRVSYELRRNDVRSIKAGTMHFEYDEVNLYGFPLEIQDLAILSPQCWWLGFSSISMVGNNLPAVSIEVKNKLAQIRVLQGENTPPSLFNWIWRHCPNVRSLTFIGNNYSTAMLLEKQALTNLRFFHLGSKVCNSRLFDAFHTTNFVAILRSIAQGAPQLVGLRLPLPTESDHTLHLEDVFKSSVRLPTSLRFLEFISLKGKVKIDLECLYLLKHVTHLSLINFFVATPTNISYGEEESCEDDEYEPLGPTLHLGGTDEEMTTNIFADVVQNRPFGFNNGADLVPRLIYTPKYFSDLWDRFVHFTLKPGFVPEQIDEAVRKDLEKPICFYPAVPPPLNDRTPDVNYWLQLLTEPSDREDRFQVLQPDTSSRHFVRFVAHI